MIPQVSPWLGDEEKDALAAVIDGNWLTEGPRCQEFTRRLLELTGAPYGVLAPNGTLALSLAMIALGIAPGDEVIVPDLTMAASAFACILIGARPVFVDVEPVNYQIDVAKIAGAITPFTRAIMPVHLFGTACDMAPIMEIAARHGLLVIEDACQGIGVHYCGQHVGTIGDVGCFSFFADKTITTGEGGFVVCKTQETYERLRLFRNQGRPNSGTFVHPSVGYNFRITEMQAAIGLKQLDRLPQIIARKRELLELYQSELGSLVQVIGAAPATDIVPFRCVIFCEETRDLAGYLRAQGVEPRAMFAPMHSQPCFEGKLLTGSDEDFPVAVEASRRGLMLPLRPTLSNEEAGYIARTVRAFYDV